MPPALASADHSGRVLHDLLPQRYGAATFEESSPALGFAARSQHADCGVVDPGWFRCRVFCCLVANDNRFDDRQLLILRSTQLREHASLANTDMDKSSSGDGVLQLLEAE